MTFEIAIGWHTLWFGFCGVWAALMFMHCHDRSRERGIRPLYCWAYAALSGIASVVMAHFLILGLTPLH